MESLMIQGAACRCQQFLALCKLRVVSLIVFTAVIGMFLAVPGWPAWHVLLAGTLGIALVAGAAAAFNCLIEQKIDALMARTRARPLPRGELTSVQTLVFSGVVGGIGLLLEKRMGQIAAQGWEFYAVTGALFVTLAFPGFVWRYLVKHRD